jgi:hypothetical protein
LDAVIVYVPGVLNEQLKLLPEGLQLAEGVTDHDVVPELAVEVKLTA